MPPPLPALDDPLLRACLEGDADILWRGQPYELCGHKALVLVREYWRWTLELAQTQRPKMIHAALHDAQAAQRTRLTPHERADVLSRVEERIAALMTREHVPVRARHTYNPCTEMRQLESWDQLEQRLRDRWGALWAESFTWPNPLWKTPATQ